MEGKLLEAARSGNLQALYDAVGEDDSILQKLHSFGCVETPLHRASMFGQAEFVREYMRLSSISAHQLSQLNRDGYSPLHLASANAHLEIVDFMLEYVKQNFAVVEVCMKKDREGRSALHSAVVSGKIEIIDVLFVNYPDAANEVTFHQETVLHLAVKHHQHEALKFLIDRKLGSSAAGLLNAGDQEGNTILHLATANRQFQIVEYLVKQPNLNVNAENSNGLRPLDMLFVNQCNSNDSYIEETITLAGGSRSQMIPTDVQIGLQHSPSETSSRSSSSQAEDDQNAKQKWFTELRNGIIVMASVFATLTFQVALTPPGGMWQDWGPNEATSNTTSSAVSTHKPGETILYDLKPFKVDSRAWTLGLNCAYITVMFIVMEYLAIVAIVTSKNVFNSPGILVSLVFWSLILSVTLVSFISRAMKLIK
ncbi:hypothetical protein Sango_2896200 [Sesamum angolense]|uniref:PGG domain-containing protein n=1 Tax=Sesamum angolense TaxID=2727404 RepID=A0AAE1VUZ4_9LAMI|nr:hypothetical protein Sango_2896200 [Sesamum angolense]